MLSALDERVSIGTVPWLFDSYAEAREVIDSTGLAYYDSVLERLDLKVIGSFHNGFRQLTNNKRPVTSPEDLKGLNIRVPGSEIYMSFFKAFGAVPSSTNWSEVFTNLQQGVIDGQENGVSITATSGMTEVQDYMTIWNYTYENDLFLVNRNIWDSLNEATQQLLKREGARGLQLGPRPARGRGGRPHRGIPRRGHAGGHPHGGAARALQGDSFRPVPELL